MAKWTKVGTLRKSKAGGLYIKVEGDVTLKKDSSLNLQDPRKKIDQAVAAGRMSADEGEGRKAKVPEYIKYEVYSVED